MWIRLNSISLVTRSLAPSFLRSLHGIASVIIVGWLGWSSQKSALDTAWRSIALRGSWCHDELLLAWYLIAPSLNREVFCLLLHSVAFLPCYYVCYQWILTFGWLAGGTSRNNALLFCKYAVNWVDWGFRCLFVSRDVSICYVDIEVHIDVHIQIQWFDRLTIRKICLLQWAVLK